MSDKHPAANGELVNNRQQSRGHNTIDMHTTSGVTVLQGKQHRTLSSSANEAQWLTGHYM